MSIYNCASVRILFPFHLSLPNSNLTVERIAEAFSVASTSWEGVKNPGTKIAHSEYYREYLPHVQQFLFHHTGATGCLYLKVPLGKMPYREEVQYQVFIGPGLDVISELKTAAKVEGIPTPRGLQPLGMPLSRTPWKSKQRPSEAHPEPLTLTFEEPAGIELWISQLGAGLLSASFCCKPENNGVDTGHDTFSEALTKLNHAFGTGQKAIWLEAPGGPVDHLHQVIRDLLEPIREIPGIRVEFELRGIAFTSLEAPLTTFQQVPVRAQITQLLTNLSHLHPESHPGHEPGHDLVLRSINLQHYYAMSLNGAAHLALVADQEPPYDVERLRRIQMEYFPGFLLAHMQRVCLQRILNESATVSSEVNPKVRERALRSLHDRVLRFGLEGEFVQVCWRQTLQHHHEVAQKACNIQEGLATVRHAMNDFNRIVTERAAAHQRVEFERAAKHHRQETKRTERTTQILEIFIVTVYSVEMAHAIALTAGFTHSLISACSLVGVAVATFISTAYLVVSQRTQRQSMRDKLVALFLTTAIIHGCFGLFNYFVVGLASHAKQDDHGSDHIRQDVSTSETKKTDEHSAESIVSKKGVPPEMQSNSKQPSTNELDANHKAVTNSGDAGKGDTPDSKPDK